MEILILVVVDIVILAISGLILYKTIQSASKNKVEGLEKDAENLLANAKREAEATKKESILEAKEEVHRLRNDFERDSRERRNEIQRLERRLIQKEESLDKKGDLLEKKEETINNRMQEIDQMEDNIQELHKSRREELERVSNLTSDEAKEILLDEIKKEITYESAMMVKDIEAKAKEEADKNVGIVQDQ